MVDIGFCGCSYTSGYGVEECERYSSLVLDQLDATGINLARGGASNTDIFHQALELVNDVDYLVVQWSAGGRGNWHLYHEYSYSVLNKDLHPDWISSRRWKTFCEVYRMIDSQYNQYRWLSKRIKILAKLTYKPIVYINGLLPVYDSLLLGNKNDLPGLDDDTKEFLEFDLQPDDVLHQRLQSSRQFIQVIDHNWLYKTPLKKIDVGTDGKHPGPETHRQIANKIVEYING